MEKTDSILNLTKPSLYGIYNSSSNDLTIENDQVEEYLDGLELHIKAKESNWARSQRISRGPTSRLALTPVSAEETPSSTSPFGVVGRLALVGLAAWAYNEVTRNIHSIHTDNRDGNINEYLVRFLHSLQPFQELVARYGFELVGIAHADFAFAMILEGVALSIVVPLLDRIMPTACTRRMLSSSPNPYKRGNLANDIIRSLIAFLGILYAIRNVEWKSSLQMALTWSLINPGLWLLLDGTISGFVASLLVAGCGSGLIYAQNAVNAVSGEGNMAALFLFIGSFFFCGVIIFGKLGRFLFA